ncbi:DUF4127 family protein [Desulfofundulus thermobenzoicus]|uniref:DUF4127 family protein n=1 Tax=Desulfofundulus thermobenzoicus TaxID=29376 RepID=A0A6N7ILR0_9FIRM|nr:DUF4127 family protein [Desulfofundulus thermobenzoicus]MQL50854.1 DUF4127 family protein [Desulfofundulus thermobenzoicus]
MINRRFPKESKPCASEKSSSCGFRDGACLWRRSVSRFTAHISAILLLCLLLVPPALAGGAPSPHKILFVPLDDRPVNTGFVRQLGKIAGVQLMMPPREMLSAAGNGNGVEQLWTWAEKNAGGADAVVLSLDTLLYGGLVPSRTHNYGEETLKTRVQKIKELKKRVRGPVYAFISIMRTPQYNTDAEEPPYYGRYGADIFHIARLMDRLQAGVAGDGERGELAALKGKVPEEFWNDYVGRRTLNHRLTVEVLELVEEGVIDTLVIGRDDSAPFGFTRMEQRHLEQEIAARHIAGRVYSFAGLDECGVVLLIRAVNRLNDYTPRVYVEYGTPGGERIVPLYEDIPLGENVAQHVLSAGGILVNVREAADLLLVVNTPEGAVGEAARQDPRNYNRRLAGWLENLVRKGRDVALADVAYANGADSGLMTDLAGRGVLSRLAGYSGWNTAGNTIGLSLAQGMLYSYAAGHDSPPGWREEHKKALLTRLLEDWGYQAVIRPQLTGRFLGERGASTRLVTWLEAEVKQDILSRLNRFAGENLRDFGGRVRVSGVDLPWHRLFDLSLTIELPPPGDVEPGLRH